MRKSGRVSKIGLKIPISANKGMINKEAINILEYLIPIIAEVITG